MYTCTCIELSMWGQCVYCGFDSAQTMHTYTHAYTHTHTHTHTQEQGSLRFPRSYAFLYIPPRHGIRHLCHADALGTYMHAMAPRDSCTLCPVGSGVLDMMRAIHAQTTYSRCFVHDTYTYKCCAEATTQKACTNTHSLQRSNK